MHNAFAVRRHWRWRHPAVVPAGHRRGDQRPWRRLEPARTMGTCMQSSGMGRPGSGCCGLSAYAGRLLPQRK
jgi:hypothetical protein